MKRILDCVPFQRIGRKVVSVLLFIYTKDNPKQGLQKLWEEGDIPLNPFETFSDASLSQKGQSASSSIPYSDCVESLLNKLQHKLSIYLEAGEVLYYLQWLQQNNGLNYDSCSQVLQVIEEKERQPKFQAGTRAYQCKSIMHYALMENLKEFGWSIPELAPNRKDQTA